MNSNAERSYSPAPQSPRPLRDFFQYRLSTLCAQPRITGADAGFALPNSSLALLRDIIDELELKQVFEFGTGRSTQLFLDCGCHVTAVEDNEDWLRRTLMALAWEPRSRLRAKLCPLKTVYDDGSPFLGWRLDREQRQALRDAELVLIDSPAFPPFREHALITALKLNRRAVVVLDDAAIPTVQRFCTRLTARNQLVRHYTRMDHGLFFFCPPPADTRLDTARGWVETVKAWRRYVLGSRLCFRPKGTAVPL